MAEGIVYLDVDDEITSAASRIRMSPATKVALVVPYGSRIATSRMNFRLLSREAVVTNRRLSIVSGDAAARSLAASAGLPVFATVGEYDSSIAAGTSPDATAAAAVAPPARPERTPPSSQPPPPEPHAEPLAESIPAADGALASSATIVFPTPAAEPEPTPEAIAEIAAEPAPRKSQRPRRPPRTEPSPAARLAAPNATAGPAESVADDAEYEAGLPPIFGTRIRAPVAAAIGLIALALVVLAVGAYVFLPAATITLVPRREPIGPLPLTISADPDATAVDAAALVVPAVRLDVPVEASDTFTTTGVHVEQTPASGSVTFENYNPVASNTVPSGSIVSTEGGVRFRTSASVTIPAGTFVLPSVIPSKRSVDVQAVDDGPSGNVPANAIRVVPQGENPDFLKVNNPDPTTGGTKTETHEVKKAEVDKAVATVQADLERVFQEALDAGANAPPGSTLFPATAQLGPVTPDMDPQTLVGQAIESFDIRLTAKGTVIAVDPSPVKALAETQIAAKVASGHELVDGSTAVDVGDGVVGEDGEVSFLATARATQVAIVDPTTLRDLVKGKTQAEATAALAPFGAATVDLWPDWASTVTSMDGRLTITIETGSGDAPDASTAPSSAGTPRPSPTRRPAASASPAPS